MLSTLLTVWLLHVAALVTPGANVLLVSHLAADGERRAATHAAMGVTIGAVIWASAAVLGVSALFARVPALRLALQGAGAVYLMHVASRMWRTPPPAEKRIAGLSRYQAFRGGLLTNLSNPKAALFFASIFTSALPSHPGVGIVVASIGLVFINALGWHLLLAFVFSRRAVQGGYASRRAMLSRVAALIMGAFGSALLVTALIEPFRDLPRCRHSCADATHPASRHFGSSWNWQARSPKAPGFGWRSPLPTNAEARPSS